MPTSTHLAIFHKIRAFIIKHIYLLLLVLVLAVVFVHQNQHIALNLLKTSTLTGVKHSPFDGTSFPFAKSVVWTDLDSSQWKNSYESISDQYKVDPFVYDASLLRKPVASLGFDKNDTYTRNLKVTYPVVYMGNYELDGIEGAGSHPAVDIKLPIGTPVLSIANGVVVKVEQQPYGFGNHVVIKHSNVPSLHDSNVLTDIYSSYSHLSTMNVKVGDVVTKEEQVALSGNSGLSTTPHLHFQIDAVTAPWHPYWMFTGPELREAGLDFFQAVNTGFKKADGFANTVHPMNFVQKFLIFNSNTKIESKVTDIEVEAIVVPKQIEFQEPELEDKLIEIIGPKKMIYGQKQVVSVLNLHKSIVASNNAIANSFKSSKSSTMLNKSYEEGVLKFELIPSDIGNYKFSFSDGSNSYALNSEVMLFKDLENSNEIANTLFDLVRKEIISGYPDGSFMPNNPLHRSELASILSKLFPLTKYRNSNLTLNFDDVTSQDWFYEPVLMLTAATVFENSENFNPDAFVTLPELLKVLFHLYKVDVNLATTDTTLTQYLSLDRWSYPYLLYGLKLGIVDTDLIRDHDQALTREQVIKILAEFLNS